MEFPSPTILIISKSTLYVKVKYLLLSTDLIFLPKVRPVKYRYFDTFSFEGSQSALHVLYDLFILAKGIVTLI